MKLKNKVALITGASRGIGAATAKLLASEGAKVVLDYHISEYEPEALENVNTVKDAIIKNGGEAITVAADVSDEKQVKDLVDATIKQYGGIDILVNNAGIVYDVPIEERTADQWHTTFDTNLLGVYLTSKHVSEHMKQKRTGKIVNLSSTSGIDALNPESIDYDATKAGVVTLTKNFAQVLAPFVNVNAVAPGWVNTEMNKDLPKDFVDKETAKIYLGRFAEPEEIANIILFLASEDANYLNGCVIVADGGRGY
jgi:3-oxoacyl-[acyl-carrier protein] reductase